MLYAMNSTEKSLPELVKSLGGSMSEPARMDYVIVSASDAKIVAEVNFSRLGTSFFYSQPMFDDGKWLDRSNHADKICIRADLVCEREGFAFIFKTQDGRSAFEAALGTQDAFSFFGGEIYSWYKDKS